MNPHCDRLPIIRMRLAIIVSAIAIIGINLWPGTETMGIHNHGMYSEYTWRWFGWPACYLTQETAWTIEVASSKTTYSDNENQFSIVSLAVNTALACSVCGLIWCTGSFIRKRQFALRTLCFVTLCVAVLSAAFAHATSSSLDRTLPWQRESEW